jgi:hypothetical protein
MGSDLLIIVDGVARRLGEDVSLMAYVHHAEWQVRAIQLSSFTQKYGE